MSDELTKPKPFRFRKKDLEEAEAIKAESKTAGSVAQILRAAVELGMSQARKRFIN